MSEVPLYKLKGFKYVYLEPRPDSGLGLLKCCALIHSNAKRFRGGLVFKAHRWLYQSTLGSRVIMKKKKIREREGSRRFSNVLLKAQGPSRSCNEQKKKKKCSRRCEKLLEGSKFIRERRVGCRGSWLVFEAHRLLYHSA